MSDDAVLRLDAKLVGVEKVGRKARVTFWAEADEASERLSKQLGSDCIVGVVLHRDVATSNGHGSDT